VGHGEDENGWSDIAGRFMRSGCHPARDLQVEVAGLELAGGDELSTVTCHANGHIDVDALEAALQSGQMRVEVQDRALDDTDGVIKSVTEEKATVERIDSGLFDGLDPAV